MGFRGSRCCYGLSNLSARRHVRDRRPRGRLAISMARQRRKAFCGLPTLAHADAHELSVTGSRTDENGYGPRDHRRSPAKYLTHRYLVASRWPMSRTPGYSLLSLMMTLKKLTPWLTNLPLAWERREAFVYRSEPIAQSIANAKT